MQNDDLRLRRPMFRLPALAAVMIVALVVRLEVVRRAEAIAPDGTIHLTMARELANGPSGKLLRAYRYHPGYPAVVAVVAKLAGADWPDGWIATGRWVSIVMSLIALAAIYYITCAIFSRPAALIAVLLFGIARGFTEVSSDCLSDAQAVALGLVAIALGLSAKANLGKRNARAIAAAVGAGLAAGLGYLTRPEMLLSGAMALVLVLSARRLTAGGKRARTAAAVLLVVVLLACAGPYAIEIGGLTQKKAVGDIVRASSAMPLAVASVVTDDLVGSMIRSWDRWRAALSTGMTILAGIWFATMVGRFALRIPLPKSVVILPTAAGWFVLFTPIIVMVAVTTSMGMHLGAKYVSRRHLLFPAAIDASMAGAGVLVLVEWTMLLADRLKLRRIPALATAAWLAPFVILMAVRAVPVLHEGKGVYRLAGRTIREMLGPGRLVLAYDGRIPFFADSPAGQFHAASPITYQLYKRNVRSPGALLEAMTNHGRPYAVVAIDTRLLARYRCPDLVARLKVDGRFKLMAILHSSPAGRHRSKVWLFRLAPGSQHISTQRGLSGGFGAG